MIDITKLSPEEIEKLDEQIQTYKSQRNLRGYKVTFYVRYNPEKHINDSLTSDGNPDSGIFQDYILDYILPEIVKDFKFDCIDEDTGCISVEELGYEEIQKAFGESIL